MRRLLVLALTSSVLLSALLAVVIAFARQQPAPDELTWLHLTDCELPCWIGIKPGVTTWEEAKEQILQTYGQTYAIHFDDYMNAYLQKIGNIENSRPDLRIEIGAYGDRRVIESISLYSAKLPPIGSLHNLLGLPYGIFVDPDSLQVIILYKHMNYTIQVGYDTRYDPQINQRAEWLAQTSHISVFEGDSGCTSRWRGFRSLYFYYTNKSTVC